MDRAITLIHVTTVPQSLAFLAGAPEHLRARGFAVHAISSPGPLLEEFGRREGVATHAVEMQRRITPLGDLVALWRLIRTFRAVRPEIVHAHTPKGGLLGSLAARLARVPVRIYTVHGLPLVTARGLKRPLLRWTEKLSCRCAGQVIAVSHSIARVMVREGLCPANKIKVLLGGSIGGVDAAGRFHPRQWGPEVRKAIRRRHDLSPEAVVLGFVGRIVRDKGIGELAEAWRMLREEFPSLHLLVLGVFEPQDPVPNDAETLLKTDPRIRLVGHVRETAAYYAAMDVCVLPTYREGFPVVLLEAAAMEVPVVATRVPGCVDAVVDGVTGLLVPPRDAAALAEAMRRYITAPELRQKHGRAGRAWVQKAFRPEALRQAVYKEYVRLLRATGALADDVSGAGARAPRFPEEPRSMNRKPCQLAVKRGFDVVVSALLLTALLPLLLCIWLMVRGKMGRPAVFCQQRPGRDGRLFTLYKFKTMNDARDRDGALRPDRERLTAWGRFLRRSSLDELPQLWNVLRGDMSLVGPRPLLIEYLPSYAPHEARRHEVRPGITGLAQVRGRNALSWEEKFAADVWYVDHWSLLLDLRILWATAWRVVRREGINAPGHATMPKFRATPLAGNNPRMEKGRAA